VSGFVKTEGKIEARAMEDGRGEKFGRRKKYV
jgi:hypothetical protein